MAAMRRADRRTSNDDNANKFPRSRSPEQLSYHELKQQRDNARADRDSLRQQKIQLEEQVETSQLAVNESEARAAQNYELYLSEQQKYQYTICLYDEEKAKNTELVVKFEQADVQRLEYLNLYNEAEVTARRNHELYLEEQQRYRETICLYDEEKAKNTTLLAKFEQADVQRLEYLTLYNQSQEDLKTERRSKAGIKGWETRRKRENERLKQEIAAMVVELKESLERKDEAVKELYSLADRMDRIQNLVDSVETETSGTPVGLLQKFKLIWLAIRDILAE